MGDLTTANWPLALGEGSCISGDPRGSPGAARVFATWLDDISATAAGTEKGGAKSPEPIQKGYLDVDHDGP
jgi:hypothetical protein